MVVNETNPPICISRMTDYAAFFINSQWRAPVVKLFVSVNVLRSQNSEYLPTLKLLTGRMNPIERENFSHGVLFVFVIFLSPFFC